jgi:hypothetical protein
MVAIFKSLSRFLDDFQDWQVFCNPAALYYTYVNSEGFSAYAATK